MAGYHNYSKSNNAIEAEYLGKIPKTKTLAFLKHLGLSRKESVQLIETVGFLLDYNSQDLDE